MSGFQAQDLLHDSVWAMRVFISISPQRLSCSEEIRIFIFVQGKSSRAVS
jgi:hypothetical protein